MPTKKHLNKIHICSSEAATVLCVHAPSIQPVAQLGETAYYAPVEPTIKTIPLNWQLQLDGTYRRVGKCPKCGKIYATRETRESL